MNLENVEKPQAYPAFVLICSDPMSTVGGQLMFGGIDERLHSGTFTYTAVVSPDSWSIKMDG